MFFTTNKVLFKPIVCTSHVLEGIMCAPGVLERIAEASRVLERMVEPERKESYLVGYPLRTLPPRWKSSDLTLEERDTEGAVYHFRPLPQVESCSCEMLLPQSAQLLLQTSILTRQHYACSCEHRRRLQRHNELCRDNTDSRFLALSPARSLNR